MQLVSCVQVDAASALRPQQRRSRRLVRAAHEFEAQMMKELMKPMTGRSSLTGEEDRLRDAGLRRRTGRVCLRGSGPGAERAGRIWNRQSHCGGALPFR